MTRSRRCDAPILSNTSDGKGTFSHRLDPDQPHGTVRTWTPPTLPGFQLLGEFGLVIPKGTCHVAERVPRLLEHASNDSK